MYEVITKKKQKTQKRDTNPNLFNPNFTYKAVWIVQFLAYKTDKMLVCVRI